MGYIGQQLGKSRMSVYVYTATGGETSVSQDDLGRNIQYELNAITVHLNGIMLLRDVDYSATTGTSITGLSALTTGDELVVIAFTTNVSSWPTIEDQPAATLPVSGSDNLLISQSGSLRSSSLSNLPFVRNDISNIFNEAGDDDWLTIKSSGSVSGQGGLKFNQGSTYEFKAYTTNTGGTTGRLVIDYVDSSTGVSQSNIDGLRYQGYPVWNTGNAPKNWSGTYTLSGQTTVYVPDGDIPREGLLICSTSGNSGGWMAGSFRNGTYNQLYAIAVSADWGLGTTSEPNSGTFRAWIENNNSGARLVLKNTATYGRTMKLMWVRG